MKKRKIGIIGLGHVGAHCAYALATQGVADELVLVDSNRQKAVSECQDLTDAGMFYPHRVTVTVGDFADLGDCDVLVNAAGKIDLLRGNHDRVQEMDFTIAAVNGFMPKVMASGFHGVILNISNPCDIVTRQIARLSGLPRGQVLGTGTGLDTARLIAALARETGFDHKSITGYMIGEHGVAQIPAWSSVTFGGRPLADWERTDAGFHLEREKIKQEAIGAAWVTFSGKFCTEYGIASTLARLARAVLHDEKQIIPVSAALCGEYGESDLFVGVPAVIGANGVERVVELDLPQEERAQFQQCCARIRRNMARLEDIHSIQNQTASGLYSAGRIV